VPVGGKQQGICAFVPQPGGMSASETFIGGGCVEEKVITRLSGSIADTSR